MEDDLTKLDDHELVQRFVNSDAEAGDPEGDALAAEIERRGLDV